MRKHCKLNRINYHGKMFQIDALNEIFLIENYKKFKNFSLKNLMEKAYFRNE